MRRNMSGNLGLYKYLWPGSVYVMSILSNVDFTKYACRFCKIDILNVDFVKSTI